MKIDSDQLQWLKTHGDRKEDDVLYDEKGSPFVWMYTPDTGIEKIYLPTQGLYLCEEGDVT